MKYNFTMVRDIFLLTLLIIVGAKIRIYTSFTPVPFTLQTFFVIFSGMYLKEWRCAPASLYLLLGFIGLPVFAGNGSGVKYVLGPTLGYLIGFIIAPVVTGYLYNLKFKGNTIVSPITGSLLILAIGSIFLGFLYRNIYLGILYGFLPFVAIEIIKAIGVSVLMNSKLSYIKR